MRRFATLTGKSLGTTFAGDQKLTQDKSKLTCRTLLLTHEEAKLLWSLDENHFVLEDNMLEWKVSDLKDFFFRECGKCEKSEFLRRGWKESRWEEGLSFQKGMTTDGKFFLMS